MSTTQYIVFRDHAQFAGVELLLNRKWVSDSNYIQGVLDPSGAFCLIIVTRCKVELNCFYIFFNLIINGLDQLKFVMYFRYQWFHGVTTAPIIRRMRRLNTGAQLI